MISDRKNTYKNKQLKHAVSLALTALAASFSQHTLALGLSDISINSYLGEPLKANIKVLSAQELTEGANCIKLGPNSDLSNANFSLSALKGTAANLTITSNQIINDPIVSLSIIAGCKSTIERSYVLLIDPPLSSQSSTVNSPVIVQKLDTSDENKPVSTAKKQAKIKKTISKAKKKKSSKKSATAKKGQQTTSPTQPSQGFTRVYAEKKPPLEKSMVEGKARLSIASGSSLTYADSAGLRLERHLKFTPDPNAIAAADIELDDEIMLAAGYLGFQWWRRRDVLKKSHQDTSAIFKTKKKKPQTVARVAKPAAEQETAKQPTVQETAAKQAAQTVNSTHDEPTTAETTAEEEHALSNLSFGIDNTIDGDDSSMKSTFEATQPAETPSILLEDEEELAVLDHADVFLSHGRSMLAIQLLQNHLLDHPKQSVTI